MENILKEKELNQESNKKLKLLENIIKPFKKEFAIEITYLYDAMLANINKE